MKQLRVLLSFIIVVAVLLASTLSVAAIGFEAEEIYESVFVIYSGNSLGSGFALGENCVITNAHVIGDTRDITVQTYGGDEYRASVIGMNEEEDIAVLAVEDGDFPYLEIADLDEMKTGDDIYAIGAPKGMAYTLTKGGISAKERKIGNQTYIQLDAPINEGNSGGPLLNDDGQVLGVNTLKMNDSEGIGLAIPITRVCDYLEDLDIDLDKNGNVKGSVDVPDRDQRPSYTPKTEQEDDTEPQRPTGTPLVTYVAIVFGLVCLVVNCVLIGLLIKKNRLITSLQTALQQMQLPPIQYDPSERTDFDIDILE